MPTMSRLQKAESSIANLISTHYYSLSLTLLLAGALPGNEEMNGCFSAEQCLLCPSQEIKTLHLNSSFEVRFGIVHAWFDHDLCHYILSHLY